MENDPWQFWGYYEQMYSTASESVASVSTQNSINIITRHEKEIRFTISLS
jgi:hypothetical protein